MFDDFEKKRWHIGHKHKIVSELAIGIASAELTHKTMNSNEAENADARLGLARALQAFGGIGFPRVGWAAKQWTRGPERGGLALGGLRRFSGTASAGDSSATRNACKVGTRICFRQPLVEYIFFAPPKPQRTVVCDLCIPGTWLALVRLPRRGQTQPVIYENSIPARCFCAKISHADTPSQQIKLQKSTDLKQQPFRPANYLPIDSSPKQLKSLAEAILVRNLSCFRQCSNVFWDPINETFHDLQF